MLNSTEYIEKIEILLPLADIELLDFVFQFLSKSVEKPTPLTSQKQSA